MNNVAKFLESRGLSEQALAVATDPDYRFELAVQLGELQTALDIAAGSGGTEAKWKQLGELAMTSGRLDVRPPPPPPPPPLPHTLPFTLPCATQHCHALLGTLFAILQSSW